MSRIGRQPVKLPDGVTVALRPNSVDVKGPRGSLSVPVPGGIAIELKDGQIVATRSKDDHLTRSLHGLTSRAISNAVTGVSRGLQRVLEITGVGYRAELKGKAIFFTLGFSHPILFQLPEGITAKVDRQVVVTLEGADRQVLGETAAAIRALRPPEPYKGKGIKYAEEKIRRKSGKAAGAA